MSWDRTLIGRAGYYISIDGQSAEPRRGAHREQQLPSIDRRRQDVSRGGGGGGCGDSHDIWIDPKNADHFVLTDDGGARHHEPTTGRLQSVSLPIGQMYHVAVDNQMPYWIYSNRQDDGTMRGPSELAGDGRERAELRRAERRADGRRRCGGGGADAAVAARAAVRRARWRAGAAGAVRRGGRWRGGAAGAAVAARARAIHRRRLRRGGGRRWPRRTRRRDVAVGPRARRLRVGLHAARSDAIPTSSGRRCYGNEVTRYDANVGRARSVSPWIHTLDSQPNEAQVPLPLDAAARDRSVRSQHRLLRLPGHLQDDERRPELEGDQPRSVDAGSDAHRVVGRHRRRQPRPVLRRGRVRDRAVGDSAAA